MRRLAAFAAALTLVAAPAAAATCAGGETLRPLLRAWAQAAHRRDSSIRVETDAGAALSADGVKALLAGRADCVSMVREPFPSELAAFRARFFHEPLLVPVARGSFATRGGTHAIAIYVNAANPLPGLTLGQLKAAFGARRPARTWGELGLTGRRAARPLHVYGMTPRRASGDPPGVVNFLQQRMLGGGAFRADLDVEIDRPGEQALAAIVRKVAEDPDGIGYSGFGYAQPGARTLPLAARAGGPFVAGSPETVEDGRYPLSRRIYVLVDRPPSPELRRFLAFVLSPPGQAMIAQDGEGFLPLTPAERVAALGLLQ